MFCSRYFRLSTLTVTVLLRCILYMITSTRPFQRICGLYRRCGFDETGARAFNSLIKFLFWKHFGQQHSTKASSRIFGYLVYFPVRAVLFIRPFGRPLLYCTTYTIPPSLSRLWRCMTDECWAVLSAAAYIRGYVVWVQPVSTDKQIYPCCRAPTPYVILNLFGYSGVATRLPEARVA